MSGLDLIIERTADGLALAFTSGNRLESFWRREPASATGQLFRARVDEIDRTLDGAFLASGDPAIGQVFLQGRDVKRHAGGKPGKRQSIERLLEVGRSLIVQGTREAVGDKGARVTAKIRIEGRLLVLQPHDGRHMLSPRLKGHEREALLEQLETIRPGGGLLARRLAKSADLEELRREAGELDAYWQAMQAERGKPRRLESFLDPIDAALWQALDWPIERVAVNDAGLAARLRRLLEAMPGAFDLELIDHDGPVFEATGVADELGLAASREVPLEPGGRILIEETAACVAIDVDGGGLPALQANLAAAEEIGRQCRLRNLGGTIIIDFIDMPTKPQIQRLEEALRKSFRSDPVPVQILPLSPLGICQISRARRGGNPFADRQKTCPTCAGEGRVPA